MLRMPQGQAVSISADSYRQCRDNCVKNVDLETIQENRSSRSRRSDKRARFTVNQYQAGQPPAPGRCVSGFLGL